MASKGKIVHLIGGLKRGGAQTQLFRLGTALQEHGWQQAVVSFDQHGVWKERLEQAAIRVVEIPRDPFKLRRLWLLQRFIKREQPDIVLSWAAHVAAYAHWLFRVGPLRRIVNVRGDLTINSDTGETTAAMHWYHRVFEKADLVVSNSHWGLQVLQRIGMNLPQRTVIYNIVSSPGGAAPSEPAEVPRIMAVGTLKPLKAYDVLLQALGLLATQGRKFQLLVAGDGPERASLENLAERLALTKHLRFLGDVDDVRPWLTTAHLFVHPSKSESLSNAILEAMAEGLPVVASAVGGNPEIVIDGRTGLLVPPGRPDLLATAIRQLLDDPPLRGRFGKEALCLVRERCSKSQAVEQYEDLFFRLLSNHHNTR
jgi:glycosyltransferase involved in cell wall biosynthesis